MSRRMPKDYKPKHAQVGDIWDSGHRRSKVLEVKKAGASNRVRFANFKANGQLGENMWALEYVFVRRTLVERDGNPVEAAS